MSESTTSAEFFETKYRDSPDPWDFAGSAYERYRYETIIAALDTRQYGNAFEPGCSVGELTYRLAGRCHHVEAMDILALRSNALKRVAAISRISHFALAACRIRFQMRSLTSSYFQKLAIISTTLA